VTITSSNPTITVLTPTFNRGYCIARVYDSLLKQTFCDFEWLIVDDGSTDDTGEIVASWIRERKLRIRYIKKENGGVHTATNAGVRVAKGDFLTRLDSDDTCIPIALETFMAAWARITPTDCKEYAAVWCLCAGVQGTIIGDLYPRDDWTSDLPTLFSLKGEKWWCYRTEVLRKYPWPELHGEKFCPESLVWTRIHEQYKYFCINAALRIYIERSNDSITRQMAAARHASINSTLLYYETMLLQPLHFRQAYRTSVNYIRFAVADGRGLLFAAGKNPRRWLSLLAAPIGLGLYALDRVSGRVGACSGQES
jgi:glycosyltransferase involved in cell wall biosynthesis